MEHGMEKDEFPNVDDFRRKQRIAKRGWWVLMAGIALEVVLGFVVAVKDEMDSPLNQPIVLISAIARIDVKGDGRMRPTDRDGHPLFSDDWRGGIGFCLGTNVSQMIFSLSATKSDVEMGNLLSTNLDREYCITFHKNIPARDMPEDDGWGKPAKIFNGVDSFILQMPQIETNTEVLSGSVVVTVNDLSWVFDIPPQKQKYGIITSARSKVETRVWPVTIVDDWYPLRFTNFFDGK
jgi:hypothetical protein